MDVANIHPLIASISLGGYGFVRVFTYIAYWRCDASKDRPRASFARCVLECVDGKARLLWGIPAKYVAISVSMLSNPTV